MKHPLVQLIELRNKAVKNKCHPKIIEMLDDRISKIGQDTAFRLRDILEGLKNEKK